MPVFLILGGASAGMTAPGQAAHGQSHDPLRSWITSNAVQVRAIDAADDDFADLEPLGRLSPPPHFSPAGDGRHGWRRAHNHG